MRNTAKQIFLSILLITCWVTIFTAAGFAEEKIQIATAEAGRYENGNYIITLFLNKGPSTPPDVYFENNLKDPNNYLLKEKAEEKEIKLPLVLVSAIILNGKKVYDILLYDVDITYKEKYSIQFRKPLPLVAPKDLVFRGNQEALEKWEKNKSVAWETSIKPQISQGDSTGNDLGDLGFELSLSRKLPKKFEFNFDASVTLDENDPNNHWKLNLYWRPVDLLLHESARIGLRPLTLSLQENATQALTLHDLSIRAFTSIFVRPFVGIQPIFLTAGLDEAVRIARDGEDFDDPRVHLQIQWEMVGLVGRGSGFFIDWQYWHRLDNFGDPKIDPSEKKERKYIELEFVIPIIEGKNLTVKYADGEVAPTFTNDKSIHIGLEILFGGQRILGPK